MRWMGSILLACILLLAGVVAAEAEAPDWIEIAQAQLDMFLGGDFAGLRAEMTEELAEALTEDTLSASLSSLGEVESQAFLDEAEEQGYHIVRFAVRQSGVDYAYRFVLDEAARLAGWQIGLNNAAEASDWIEIAQAQLDMFLGGDFAGLRAEMTEELAEALTEEALSASLSSLGEVESQALLDEAEEQGYHIVRFAVRQSGVNYVYRFVLDEAARLAGWQIGLNNAVEATSAPAADVYTEDVLLRPGESDETEGILTLPAAEGRFPAVILVQGSGPSDMNESAYGITPFQDIAEGLARRGIASIRYDKYTYAHADLITDVNSLTVDDEYTYDAQAALDILLADERIGAIYLLGHSQGGMLMPRIVSKLGAAHFSGGISLAGSPLPLWRIQLSQNQSAIERLSGQQKEEAQQVIDAELEKLDAMADWTEEELKQNTFFGVSAYYQWDEMSVDAAQAARENGVPVLVLQGDADWQVTPENGSEAWREALPEATVICFDKLTHLFTEVESPTGTVSDYVPGNHVSEDVIDAIADWILATE